MKFKTTIERNRKPHDLLVAFWVEKAEKPSWYCPGVAPVAHFRVFLHGWDVTEKLTVKELDRIEEECFEEVKGYE